MNGEVSEYILHKPPMRLIEELMQGDATSVTAALIVRVDSTFYDASQRGVPAWVGLEYMAQTAGVWVGLDDVRHGRPVELGFLVSARQYQARHPVFPLGQRLLISVRTTFCEESVVVFSGQIYDEAGEEFATADFTAYRPGDVGAYLRGEM